MEMKLYSMTFQVIYICVQPKNKKGRIYSIKMNRAGYHVGTVYTRFPCVRMLYGDRVYTVPVVNGLILRLQAWRWHSVFV